MIPAIRGEGAGIVLMHGLMYGGYSILEKARLRQETDSKLEAEKKASDKLKDLLGR